MPKKIGFLRYSPQFGILARYPHQFTMKPIRFFEHIRIDEYSATPKYLQLTNSILIAIEAGKISKNDMLPSINELSYELEISRDTAEKGYKYLKKIGVLA